MMMENRKNSINNEKGDNMKKLFSNNKKRILKEQKKEVVKNKRL